MSETIRAICGCIQYDCNFICKREGCMNDLRIFLSNPNVDTLLSIETESGKKFSVDAQELAIYMGIRHCFCRKETDE